MPFKTLYESDFYRIEADLESGLVRSEWLRLVDEKEVKTGGTKLYEVLRDTKVELAIANAKAMGTLTGEAKEWLSVTFYELLSQTNLKKLARVLPSTVYHRIALESVITRAEALGATRFAVKNFQSTEEAFRWIRE
jgi:hypothetical protein